MIAAISAGNGNIHAGFKFTLAPLADLDGHAVGDVLGQLAAVTRASED